MQLVKDGEVRWEGSVRDFLCAAPDGERALVAYRSAVEQCQPSEGTRRKWLRVLDLKFGVVPE